MKRRLLSVLLCALLVFSCVPTALADNDTTPPDLVSVSVNKTEFNVGETVVFTVKATDAVSGLEDSSLDIYFQNKGFQVLLFQQDEDTLIGELTLDKNMYQSGDYQVKQIYLLDKSGNRINYVSGNQWSGSRVLPPEMAITIHVTNNERTDWEGPVLYSLTADKTTANAGDTINFEAVASDASSGLYRLAAGLVGPKTISFDLSPVEGDPNKLVGSVKIPTTYPSGTYICDGCMIFDQLYNCTYYSSNPSEYSKQTPNEAKVSIAVTGTQQIISNVSITDVQITPASAKQGEPINFRVTLNDGGNPIEGMILSITPRVWAASHSQQIGYTMTKVSDSVYECSIVPPVNWPTGEYVICEMVWLEVNSGNYPDWKGKRYPSGDYFSFNVAPVFSGTENKSIMVGSPAFDPMAGISAANSADGDMTAKIEVTGSVDTTKTGVYLLKYKIPSMYKDSWTNQTLYYYDFRWIGVTEIMPPSPASNPLAPLALTNDSLTVGASQSEVSIAKNGSGIGYSSVVNDPGVYTLSSNGGASAASMTSQAESVSDTSAASTASAAMPSKTATAVIDRSGPALSPTWSRIGYSYFVSVDASDPSGITQLKYMAGERGLSDFQTGGTDINGSFTVQSPGTYTVYARDAFGYESLSTISVTSPDPSPYLYGIDTSAGTLSRAFSNTVYSYKITLDENQPNMTLTPVKEWEGASMTINGKKVSSLAVNLANGKTAKVKVKVTYGRKSKTYTFSITRAKSSDNNLASLTNSTGIMNLPFDPNVTNYTLNLDESTKSVTLKAAKSNSMAKVSPATKKLTLKNGQSKILKFTVKAQSGVKKTYTVTVIRAPSTNTNLKTLKTSVPLSPGFNAAVTDYTVTLPAEKSVVTVSAKAFDRLSKVTINGAKKSSQKVTLANGQSITVTVVVTAQSGAKMEYTVTINRL